MLRDLGKLIRESREAAGLSQSALAKAIGAHSTSVSGWERGVNEPSREYRLKIAKAVGRDAADFGVAEDRTIRRKSRKAQSGDIEREIGRRFLDLIRDAVRAASETRS